MSNNDDNIKLNIHYDPKTDILDVSFGSSEPAFGRNINDVAILHYGMYSGKLLALEVLGVSDVVKQQQ